MMRYKTFRIKRIHFALLLGTALLMGQPAMGQSQDRTIEFPDIPGYLTLKCDFHMHTVLSDGNVWPNIRVQEALGQRRSAVWFKNTLVGNSEYLVPGDTRKSNLC